MGQIVLLSVAGSLYQNMSRDKIGHILPDAGSQEILQLTQGTHSTIYKSLNDAQQAQVVEAVAVAIRNGITPLVPASALALIGSLFLSVSVRCAFLPLYEACAHQFSAPQALLKVIQRLCLTRFPKLHIHYHKVDKNAFMGTSIRSPDRNHICRAASRLHWVPS